MVLFKCGKDPVVTHCGTAKHIQEEVVAMMSGDLSSVRAVVHFAPGHEAGRAAFIMTFTNPKKTEMEEKTKGTIRGIVQGSDFKDWITGVLARRHEWDNFRIRVPRREKPEEYVWAIEQRSLAARS
ncbi:MAG: hypothetical protein K9M10_00820 [Candidatus Pacebacteria bacterium]|nr:hypothetical protein [Candidatus Paceibacterota bacterium]MCF7857005.1 hypothetical protein [Candidatus Paceibacterota bacterium]